MDKLVEVIMEFFPGSQCYFCQAKFPKFYFTSREIPASFKICVNENTSTIISSHCHRRSVPVGAAMLRTITFLEYTFIYIYRGKAFIESHHWLCKFTLKSCWLNLVG